MPRVPRAQPADPARINPPANGHARSAHLWSDDSIDEAKLLAALRGVRAGDFGVRLPLDWMGVPGAISEVFNEVVETQPAPDARIRAHQPSGERGRPGCQDRTARVARQRIWLVGTCIDSMNLMLADLTRSRQR